MTRSPLPSVAASTSLHRSAATSERRNPPWNSKAAIAESSSPRARAVSSDSVPRPFVLGCEAVARIAARLSAVQGFACPRPRPVALRRKPARTRSVAGPVGLSRPERRARNRTAATTIEAEDAGVDARVRFPLPSRFRYD